MKRETYNQILEKLNKRIYIDRDKRSVSPTSDFLVKGKMPLVRKFTIELGIPFIKKETDLDVLSDNQIILIHSLLHSFYAKGGTKELEKQDIEYLHKKIRGKIKHTNFDMLDKNDDTESN